MALVLRQQSIGKPHEQQGSFHLLAIWYNIFCSFIACTSTKENGVVMQKNTSSTLEFAPGTAQDMLVQGQDVLLVGIALTRIGQFAVAFKEAESKTFNEWLAAGAPGMRRHNESDGPTVVLNSSLLYRFGRELFELSFHNSVARQEIEDRLNGRLDEAIRRINEHPMMEGLPPVELVIPHGYEKFEIRFVLDARS